MEDLIISNLSTGDATLTRRLLSDVRERRLTGVSTQAV
jgi:hypothetical protein